VRRGCCEGSYGAEAVLDLVHDAVPSPTYSHHVEDMMTVVRLQRHAPEAQNATICAVCGTTDKKRVTDHIQVGTPGSPQHDAGVCESCGAVIDQVVDKYGGDLTMMVQDAQQDASEREITIPGSQPRKPK
jgi:hypothetical protein